ncbi:hypothetical protein JHJ32_13680 [Parapedobacter sp. ISTM3]|uniref:hypothetical protein n=1 Tax=Parapedobacter sp. ISTM3 TaxID=2800130 RepID=UPI0019031ADB|nr:hypothetical protein [Parapedobacter sp. ISTM3]MBK1441045.1 hypothetical protein [Parapedobacter sp. ISTM3]
MNERKENKELIQRMAEALRNHVEPYREGAWERFSAMDGGRRPRALRWPYWGAAAVLLLAVGLFWFSRQPGDVPDIVQYSVESPVSAPSASDTQRAVESPVGESGQSVQLAQQAPDGMRGQHGQRTPAAEQPLLSMVVSQTNAATDSAGGQHFVVTVGADDSSATTKNAPRLAATAEGNASKQEQSFGRFLEQGVSRHAATDHAAPAMAAAKTRHDARKWNLGLVVSPSMTSEKVNMGGGIAVAYRLSDKFSIGSGVSIGQLGVGENPDYQPGSSYDRSPPVYASPSPVGGYSGFTTNAEQYKQDISVTSSVVTLDIPIDLRYEVARGFYTSVGVSYVAVLNEQRTNHFVGQLNERTFGETNSAHRDLTASTELVSMSERSTDRPLEGKGYAGFMNFSIGRKMPISRKISLAVEPYFKLPIGRLSKEEMDFTNGGIRIVTGF